VGTPSLLVKDYDPGGLVREISLCRKRRRIGRFKRLDSFRDTQGLQPGRVWRTSRIPC